MSTNCQQSLGLKAVTQKTPTSSDSATQFPQSLYHTPYPVGIRKGFLTEITSFLHSASSVTELTPNLGTEVRGVNLAALTNDERDQVALEVN